MKRHNRFDRAGCFNCAVCKRQTRNTGDNGGCGLCPECYEIAGMENYITDNGAEDATSKEYAIEIAKLTRECIAKGGKL